MKRLLLKIGLASLLGFTGILLFLALMTQLGTAIKVAYAAGPRYVAPSGSDSGNDCANSANPCATLQYAVDVAEPGDVIKVATGVYTGVNNYGGVSQTLYLSKSIIIEGGYTLAFSEPPDPVANPTTLDAQSQGGVLYITGDISATIAGLRLTGGEAGSGISIFTATVTLSNNDIFSNSASYGGGLSLNHSRATLINNTILSNTAEVAGGGLYLNESSVTLTNNWVVNNQTDIVGSGLYVRGSSAHLFHNTFSSNSGGSGSGLYVTEASGPETIYSNVFLTNTIIAHHHLGFEVSWDNAVTLQNTLWYSNANFGDGFPITGSNSYLGNPAFLNPAAGDYHLGPNSAAIDKGIAAGVVTDIDGEARTGTPDLGADESSALSPAIMVEGGAIWASNSETTVRLVNHDLAEAPYSLKLYDSADSFVQTITSNASGNSQEPIPWVVPDLNALGKSSCDILTGKMCTLRSFDKNETLVAEAQVIINRPQIVMSPPPSSGPYFPGQVVYINLLRHTPGKQHLIKLQGALSMTRVYTSPVTNVMGNTYFQWILEEECDLNSGWPDGFYTATTHLVEQPSRQIARLGGIQAHNPTLPSLMITGGNTWYAGSTLEISLHRHLANAIHFLEFNNERIPTPAEDDTVKIDGCGNATVSYTLPLTLTPGSYDLQSFRQSSNSQVAKQTITVLPPASVTIEGGQRWFPGASVTFRLDNHLANAPYQLWLDRNGPQATLLSALISDAQGQGNLTYSLPVTFPLKSAPGYMVQSYLQPGDTLAASSELELILPLTLGKAAPATAAAGLPFTYTLRITNAMPFSLTHLVLTDTLPAGASYIAGGTKVGQVVSWTLSSLAPGATATRTFVVTAIHSLTNHNYAARTGEGAQVKGITPVVTLIEENEFNKKQLYLPLLVKN